MTSLVTSEQHHHLSRQQDPSTAFNILRNQPHHTTTLRASLPVTRRKTIGHNSQLLRVGRNISKVIEPKVTPFILLTFSAKLCKAL